MIKVISGIVCLGTVIMTSGCASIVTGHNQTLSVETPGCAGAKCELKNSKGTWYVPSTPGTVTVRRAYGDMTVMCSKEGVATDAVGSASSSTKGMAFGNILFGGIVGAGIDAGTGAAYDYPTLITVPMDCATTDRAATPATMPVAPVVTPAAPAAKANVAPLPVQRSSSGSVENAGAVSNGLTGARRTYGTRTVVPPAAPAASSLSRDQARCDELASEIREARQADKQFSLGVLNNIYRRDCILGGRGD